MVSLGQLRSAANFHEPTRARHSVSPDQSDIVCRVRGQRWPAAVARWRVTRARRRGNRLPRARSLPRRGLYGAGSHWEVLPRARRAESRRGVNPASEPRACEARSRRRRGISSRFAQGSRLLARRTASAGEPRCLTTGGAIGRTGVSGQGSCGSRPPGPRSDLTGLGVSVPAAVTPRSPHARLLTYRGARGGLVGGRHVDLVGRLVGRLRRLRRHIFRHGAFDEGPGFLGRQHANPHTNDHAPHS